MTDENQKCEKNSKCSQHTGEKDYLGFGSDDCDLVMLSALRRDATGFNGEAEGSDTENHAALGSPLDWRNNLKANKSRERESGNVKSMSASRV